MAGKCKEMNKIKQALRLHLDGESNRSIGRQLDLYKGTVNKYITLAESCGIPIPVLLAMEEPEIERVLTGGNPAYSDSRFQDLKERLPYIASELERKHMTMFLLCASIVLSIRTGMVTRSSVTMSINIRKPRNHLSYFLQTVKAGNICS